MILPNYHEDIKHWSFFVIDKEIKGVYLVDSLIATRNEATRGISSNGWQYDEKTKAILKLLLYNSPEIKGTPFKLTTVETIAQKNTFDCGVLACYLAYAFSKRLSI